MISLEQSGARSFAIEKDNVMTRILSRMSVSFQIGIVGLLGVFGLIAVGVVAYIGSRDLANSRLLVERANFDLAKLGELKIDLLEARRSEKDFLLRRKEDYVGKHGAALAEFTRDADELYRSVGEQRRGQLTKVTDAVVQYKQAFDVVVGAERKIGLDENSGLQGKLRASVHAIEEIIASDQNDGLEAAMLMMRRHEKDFFARVDRKYVDLMKEAARRFVERLSSERIPAEHKPLIKAKLDSYQNDFQMAAEASLQAVEAIALLSKAYSDAEPLIAELDRLVHAKADDEKVAAEAVSARAQQTIGWSIALIIVGVGMLAWLIGRGIARPLTRMSGLMERLAKGDLEIAVTDIERRDVVGVLARSLEIFKQSAIDAKRLEAEQRVEQAKKEERQIAIERHIAVFESGVRTSLDMLASAATEMRATSQSMSATAEETSAQATTVAAAAEQASANVQTVAAATEELSSSVSEIGRQVTQSTKIAGQAVEEAERTNVTVQGLSAAAQKIGDVIKLISDIASQTNLLALNATIEAARAGEAGKGFAVVASEVKSLANQTAKATDDISLQVAAMQGATRDAVQAIQSIGTTIGSINEIATTIAAAVEEQGAATLEIARNVQEAAQGTGQVSSNIVGVNQAAGETGAAANQVLAAAEELGKQAETLRADVDSFLANIRIA
jgi:methyl-accepting chemotaxis protein